MDFLKRWKAHIIIFFAVIGPGFITANVDNDAGGIYTYSLAGARYGYALLWTLVPVPFVLIVVQEMSARLGAVTGKGLADLIREEFGFRITFVMMLALTVTNLANVMAEFAGVASSMEIFGVSKYLSVPVAASLGGLLAAKSTIIPTVRFELGYLTMFVGIIGATVAPWMQFYLQSAIVEKGVEQKQYAQSKVG